MSCNFEKSRGGEADGFADSPVALTRKSSIFTNQSRKLLSSKWEEAEKWVKTSPLHPIQSPGPMQKGNKKNVKQFPSSPSMTVAASDDNQPRNFLKDRFMDMGKGAYNGLEHEEARQAANDIDVCSLKSKKVSPSTVNKTQATTSVNIGVFDGSSMNCWNPREEREELAWNSLENRISAIQKYVPEEKETRQCCIRCRREESKIQAWVNLQDAKAEAELKKLELKIERMRSNMEEKLMKRMATVEKRAERWRAAAQASHAQHISLVVSQKSERMKTEEDPIYHLPAYFC